MTTNIRHRMNSNPWRHKIRHRLETHLWRKTNFVTDDQMWCHHSDQTKTVTKMSQKTNCDHSGVFNDVNATSLMTTSLLVATKLIRSSSYHPQTDGHTERINQSLEDMLRESILQFDKSWAKCLSLAEFSTTIAIKLVWRWHRSMLFTDEDVALHWTGPKPEKGHSLVRT
jgi:hypothetical protein